MSFISHTYTLDSWIPWSMKSEDTLFKSLKKCIGPGEEKLANEMNITSALGGQNSVVDLVHPIIGNISVKDMTNDNCTLGIEGATALRETFNSTAIALNTWSKAYANKCKLAKSYYEATNQKYGGAKKFNKRYKKEIAESKINCGCEDPIYKTFLLDLKTRYAYKVFHPQSNNPKLDGDFRLKKNIGKKALHKTLNTTGKIIHNIENAIGLDVVDALLVAYIIYSAADNPQGIFKKSKGSSNVPGSSSVSKSLSSGSGSVLDKKFGEVTLKQLIGASRR